MPVIFTSLLSTFFLAMLPDRHNISVHNDSVLER